MSVPVRSPISEMASQANIPFANYHGAMIPEWYSDPVSECRAVRTAAGIFDFSFRAKFSAGGSDRVRFIHGMVSNDVKSLTPGRGVYATLLDVRGHILADLEIYCRQDKLLIDTDVDLIDKVLQTLNHYNIGGRVPLERLSLSAVSVQGPKARGVIQAVLGENLPGPEDFSHISANFEGHDVVIIRASNTGEEGYQVWIPKERARVLWEALLDCGKSTGLLPCGSKALEILRIEAGVPEYGSELAEDTLPLEAGLLNALSFTKGCYIGQEIVERARSRGHVNWKLVGLFVDAMEAPAAGEKILREGKEVGEITSACVSPTLGTPLAMGYIRKEASEPGMKVTLASGPEAEVTTMPFYRCGPADAAG